MSPTFFVRVHTLLGDAMFPSLQHVLLLVNTSLVPGQQQEPTLSTGADNAPSLAYGCALF